MKFIWNDPQFWAEYEADKRKQAANDYVINIVLTCSLGSWTSAPPLKEGNGIDVTHQRLEDITRNEDAKELLSGQDVLESCTADLFGMIVYGAFTLTVLLGIKVLGEKLEGTSDRYPIYVKNPELAVNAVFSSAVGYSAAQGILGWAALNLVTATNPLLHLALAPIFAVSFAVNSVLLEEYGLYRMQKKAYSGSNDKPAYLNSFPEYLKHKKAKLFVKLWTKFCMGLSLYGCTLIPGMGAERIFAAVGSTVVASVTGQVTGQLMVNKYNEYTQPANERRDINNSNDSLTRTLLLGSS